MISTRTNGGMGVATMDLKDRLLDFISELKEDEALQTVRYRLADG